MFASASKKVIAAALVAGALTSTFAATSAEAGWHHRHGYWRGAGWGLAGAGLALGVIGAAAAANAAGPGAVYEDDVEYRRVCRLERRYDEYGNYLGRGRVCRTVAY